MDYKYQFNMMYNLISQLLKLVKDYENTNPLAFDDVETFRDWLNHTPAPANNNSDWVGKANGRSTDSVINTSLVHLYRYAKRHSKEALSESPFSTPDDFFYLISLDRSGEMSKSALIRENVHDKPVGTLIINRLLAKGFIEQKASINDKRSQVLNITATGRCALQSNLEQIRGASANVTEPLNEAEKLQLLVLLQKLENFHQLQGLKTT